ncbi:MAG: hypothetical protein H7256_07625 [Bdellovibrio sp.]|nr:hypothetical protein [Bdellovibrio sp.]
MAATYSSFMTTRFYSPVFNTALFDGPFRIYFSQAYESSALKVYHLLQTEYQDLWNQVKEWSLVSKEHVFLLMYPEISDVQNVFNSADSVDVSKKLYMQDWEEGLAIGLTQPNTDLDLVYQLEHVQKYLANWLQKQNNCDVIADA